MCSRDVPPKELYMHQLSRDTNGSSRGFGEGPKWSGVSNYMTNWRRLHEATMVAPQKRYNSENNGRPSKV